jgi:cell division protein FtsQ
VTGLFSAPVALASARPFFGPKSQASLAQNSSDSRAKRRRPGRSWGVRLHALAVHPIATGALVIGVLAGSFAYAAVRGGAYDQFIQEVGTPGDLLARAFGMGIDTVTISGISELKEREILAIAGVKARNSLPYLDATAIRLRLMSVPLIKDAEVRKLYPNRLAITVVERQPYALWQKDGKISIVAADGMPIDTLHDDKYVDLPLIVGDGANGRIGEYTKIVAAAGDLGPRIRAGALVSQRRWTIHTTDGIEIRLPEIDPEGAIANLVRIERDEKSLEKDIVALDLRAPGRIEVRLSDEAASARLDKSHKPKGKV